MALPVLVFGRSGSGKTYSLKNFAPDEIGVISVEKGRLPFRSDIKVIRVPKAFSNADPQQSYATLNAAKYAWIIQTIKAAKVKSIAIDDSQYLLAFESFDRAKETGYGKFTDLAVNFRNLIDFVIKRTPDDVIVYFLHHTEYTDDGRTKAKTIGKMLDNQLTVEGLFSIVLLCKTDGTRHYFETQSDGKTTAKSPLDMFEREIDNDLKFVDDTIRAYWEI
jgi:hypothetical protein